MKAIDLGKFCATVAVVAIVILGLGLNAADGQQVDKSNTAVPVVVMPKFGGQILGYDIDHNGTEGLLAEYVAENGGKNRVAVEVFDQKTGAITAVVAEKNETLQDYAAIEINGDDLGLVLFQKAGQNNFLTLNPLTANKFTGVWTPPIKSGYGVSQMSVARGTNVAVFENDLNAGDSYVVSSNVADNTFSSAVSLSSIISVDEFLVNPVIALGRTKDEVVLADSHDCPEKIPSCASSIAMVNLTTGKITEFDDDLGVGQVNGLAVDPVKGIAVTTTLADMGVEFYNLKAQTGFEEILPGATSEIQAGDDVEFDPVHKLFLVAQYTSTGDINNPQPRVYVYNEAGKLMETVTTLPRIPVSPTRIVLNPSTRTGFLVIIAEPSNTASELESFKY
ncbi:MAG TPA: hypothetical protein VF753_11390 [Terriglobales bacterium]